MGKSEWSENRLVLCAWNESEAIAKNYAKMTCSDFFVLSNLSQITTLLKEGGRTICLFASPKILTSKQICQWNEDILYNEIPSVIGIFTGRNQNSLGKFIHNQFKILETTESALYDELWNVQQYYCHSSIASMNPKELFEKSWESLVLHAHGEASHIFVKKTILCGGDNSYLSPTEILCQNKHCRKNHDKSYDVVPAHHIRVSHLVLLSCHSFSVAGEHYESQNANLVFSLTESGIKSLFCSVNALSYRLENVSWFYDSMISGERLGSIWLKQNQALKIQHQIPGIVLIGDPDHRCHVPLKNYRPEFKEENYKFNTWISLNLPKRESDNKSEIPYLSYFRIPNSIITRTKVHANKINSAEIDRFHLRRNSLKNLTYYIRYFVGFLDLYSQIVQKKDEPFRQELEPLFAPIYHSLRYLQNLVRECLFEADKMNDDRCIQFSRINYLFQYIKSYINNFHKALIPLVESGILTDHCEGLLHKYGIIIKSYRNDVCSRCKSTVYSNQYLLQEYGEMKRVFKICPSCGPKIEFPHIGDNAPFSVRIYSTYAALQVELDSSNLIDVWGDYFSVVLGAFDKNSGNRLALKTYQVPYGNRTDILDLSLPIEDMQRELHTLKGCVLSFPYIAIFRERFL